MPNAPGGQLADDHDRSALLITGTVGAGKTAVAVMVGHVLSQAAIPNAVIDLDWLRRSWPAPKEDRFNSEVELRNLKPMARNYFRAGAVRLLMAGVVETRAARDRYHDVLGVPLLICRLRVALPVVHARLVRRHADDPVGLPWHVDRSRELNGILEAAAVEDVIVEATQGDVAQVADRVIRAVGWDRSPD
ncbi:MAG: adenylyl-sulfate kinase [Actinomycetota bacterium]|nr:adenylyl-sulfate kinase [Actinomycetota bacterium]